MRTNEIPERLSAMRQFMEEKSLDAFIIPSTDAHLSEYPQVLGVLQMDQRLHRIGWYRCCHH